MTKFVSSRVRVCVLLDCHSRCGELQLLVWFAVDHQPISWLRLWHNVICHAVSIMLSAEVWHGDDAAAAANASVLLTRSVCLLQQHVTFTCSIQLHGADVKADLACGNI